mmetsp:Transcript_14075/g.24137  ORF Transcript_14075/g.24137 Transcript_14075/m.24137 type:complete len:125 (-) Transcript_14075:122-496(-)
MSTGQWQSSICGCFSDCGACCYGYWCGGESERQVLSWVTGAQDEFCCDGPCLGCLCCTSCNTAYLNRKFIRSRYAIPGSTYEDCCVVMCCHWCAVCQHRNEMTKRKQQEGPKASVMQTPPPTRM